MVVAERKPGLEARRAERTRTLLGARAIFNDGRSALDCQIRNISATGARLALSESLSLPSHFDLEIPAQNCTRRVVLRWRNAGNAGVQFDDGFRNGEPAMDPRAELEMLRSENAILRRRIGEMTRRLSELGFSGSDI